jgi:hypothetical protein
MDNFSSKFFGSFAIRSLAFLSAVGSTIANSQAQNSAIVLGTVYEGPSLPGTTCCTVASLPPEPSIAVGEHWIVLAVNYSVFMYKRSALPVDSSVSTQCFSTSQSASQHKGFTSAELVKRAFPGSSTNNLTCNRVSVPNSSGTAEVGEVFDLQVVFNPHRDEFALITGGNRQFFITDVENPNTPPFCGSGCQTNSTVRGVNLRPGTINIYHRSWLGFDAENYYVSHRTGGTGGNQVHLYVIDPSTSTPSVTNLTPTGGGIDLCPRGIASVQSYDPGVTLEYPFVGISSTGNDNAYFFKFTDEDSTTSQAVPITEPGDLTAGFSFGSCTVSNGGPGTQEVWSAVARNGFCAISRSEGSPIDGINRAASYVFSTSGPSLLYSNRLTTNANRIDNTLDSVDTPSGPIAIQSHAIFPAITMNSLGQLGFVYTAADSSPTPQRPALAVGYIVPGRCSDGAKLVMNRADSSPKSVRWGDYFGATVDPINPAVVWYAGMYLKNSYMGPCQPSTAPAWNVKFGSFTVNVPTCDIDFNNDNVFPDDKDYTDFMAIIAGAACPTSCCDTIDFNGDGVFPTDQDVLDFLDVVAGAPCP